MVEWLSDEKSAPLRDVNGGVEVRGNTQSSGGFFEACFDGMNEGELIDACLCGDEHAWRALIARFYSRIYALTYHMLGNREEAMDATQDVFIKVLKGLKRFRKNSALSTWMYRIAINVCTEHLRKRHEAPISSLTEDERNEAFATPDPSPSPEEVAERMEIKELVRAAIRRLPMHMRLVIVLCDLDGLSYKEAASVLGIPVGTVKSRLNRARFALKDELSKMMG